MKLYVMKVLRTLYWGSPEQGISVREEDGSFFPGEKIDNYPELKETVHRAQKSQSDFFEEVEIV